MPGPRHQEGYMAGGHLIGGSRWENVQLDTEPPNVARPHGALGVCPLSHSVASISACESWRQQCDLREGPWQGRLAIRYVATEEAGRVDMV